MTEQEATAIEETTGQEDDSDDPTSVFNADAERDSRELDRMVATPDPRSFMVTVEFLIPSSLEGYDDIEGDIESYVENELTGPLDFPDPNDDDGDEIEVDVGAVGSIDPALIDDGVRFRHLQRSGQTVAEAGAQSLIDAKGAVAQAVTNNRGELETAIAALGSIHASNTNEAAEGLREILTALDAWNTATIAVAQEVG